MNHTSQNILKEVLLEYMETEAALVPPTEELMGEHTFSEQFLRKMKMVLEQKEKTVRQRNSEKKTEHANQSGRHGFFRGNTQNHVFLRVAAACLICVIVFGAGWMIYRGTGGLTSSDSSATDMAAGSEEMAADSEEAVTEDMSGAALDDSDVAQAETDLADFNVSVKSYTAYSMELELVNETGAEITYGGYYVIEAYDEDAGTWVAAEQIYDGVFEESAYLLQDGETAALSVDWSNLYGELEEGTWRLVKEVQSMGDEEFYTLTVLFEI